MTPSEPATPPAEPAGPVAPPRLQRLHPASLLFTVGSAIRRWLWPALLVLLLRRGGDGYETSLLVLFVPSVGWSLLRYYTLRYRLDAGELVIREGLIERRERSIPFDRIQNIDTIQSPVHRLLGVADVLVETAGGGQAEAELRVLSLAAVDEMRGRVFARRQSQERAAESAAAGLVRSTVDAAASPPAAEPEQAVLRMSVGELTQMGLLYNRGMVVIGGAWALAWQADLLNRAWMRRLIARTEMELPQSFGEMALWQQGALALALVVAFLATVRLFSVGWALVTLYDFTLTRRGDELRTRFGMFTRHTVTIPRRRIQVLHLYETWLHRRFGRVSIRVETAGARGERDAAVGREWLVPLVRRDRLTELLALVQPELSIEGVAWRGVDSRAGRRVARRSLLIAAAIVGVAAWYVRPWIAVAAAVAAGWMVLNAWISVVKTGWGVTDAAIVRRRGWLTRQWSAVRFGKVQSVHLHESPFDRRWQMADVVVDTAGVGGAGGERGLSLEYLSREDAESLRLQLADSAATAAFKW